MPDAPILAWVCTAKDGISDPPDPCIVYAQRRSQAMKIAYNNGPGFDMVDYTDIRCRRAPEHDGTGQGIGMYNPEDGSWYHETFRRYGR